MSDYLFMRETYFQLKMILSQTTKLELKMATLQEIMEATRAEQDLIKAALDQTAALIKEVKQLLDVNDVTGAQALLDDIQANSEALVAAVHENADLTALVDAVNGDPQPAV